VVVVQVLQPSSGGELKLKINQDDVTWGNLSSRLTDIFKTRAERMMFVKGDDDVEFQYVARVIDMAKGTNVINRVGLITAKIEAGQFLFDSSARDTSLQEPGPVASCSRTKNS